MAKKNEQKRTIAFVCFGIGACLIAGVTHFLTQPDNSKDFELVGQPFFEEFDSAEKAKSLEVAALDTESAQLKRFSVAEKAGLWRIPSHYDYPAEAAERLATTATSVLGIQRESLVGRLASDHERFGVIDPLGDDAGDPEATGKRITLKDGDDETLVDFIIGKEAGDVEVPMAERAMQDGPPEKYYYVRRPDETQTYKVRLNVDLSTRFSDWIEPDLLKLDKSQLRRIDIDNYELQEQGGLASRQIFKVEGDKLQLSREDGFGNWKLEGLNEESEEIDNSRVTEIVNIMDEMKIVGVRPKFKFKDQQLLTADLKVNQIPELQSDPRAFNRAMAKLQSELSQRGFNFIKSPDLTLVSTGGELSAGTEDGVVYSLNFGKSIEGDEAEIEIGGNESASEKETGDDNSESSPDASDQTNSETTAISNSTENENENPAEAAAGTEEEAQIKNRYLMIRVSFDESLLGEKPTMPIEPTKPVEPEGYTPPPEKDKPAEQDSATTGNDNEGDQQKPEGDKEDAAPAPETTERDPAFLAYDQALAEYDQQQTQYTLNMTRYKNDLEEYEAKIAAGREKVGELNERFGDWYYVISADNLKSLKTTRADIVKAKPEEAKPEETNPAVDAASKPNIDFPMPKVESQPPSSSPPIESDAADSNAETTKSGGEPNPDAAEKTDEKPPTQAPESAAKGGRTKS